MRRTAGLHDHGAARLLLEEGDQLVARQLALELDLALCIDTMEMKDGLGCIHPDHANAHPGRLPCCVFRRPHLGTSRSEERRVGKECRCGWSPYHENKR